MTTTKRKWRTIWLSLAAFGIVSVALIVAPFVVMSTVQKESGVRKQKQVILYDNATGKQAIIPKASYGFAPEAKSDKYYISDDIFKLAQDVKNLLVNYTIDVIGDVIFINNAGQDFYYIRRVSSENVNNQGYEYRTSNMANLLIHTQDLPRRCIYAPYHLLACDSENVSERKVISGYLEQDMVYRTLAPWDMIASFYKAYPFFKVQESADKLIVTSPSSEFVVIREGEYDIRYDTLDCPAEIIRGQR